MSQHDPTAEALSVSIGELTEMSVEDVASQDYLEVADTIEPTSQGIAVAASPNLPIAPIPIPIPKRPVSGRYRGTLGGFQLELRVDVDRVRPQKKVSGDFFSVSGGTVTYFGSFIVHNPVITITATQVVCKGTGQFTFTAGAPVLQVTIQRRTIFQPQAPAQAQFLTTGGSPGALYSCVFESASFRSVRLETDRVSDVVTPVFSTYNTGTLPSGGPARNLTVMSAFGEAGIEMTPTAASNTINIAAAGLNTTWSNAEMHASMQTHFSLFQNTPQWNFWLLVAQKHDFGAGLLGIMFDQQGPQRQGCAVFHQGLGGTTAQAMRVQLQTYVHELGHSFNLLHSWQKSLATPAGVDRPNSLSWMNYPWKYPLGGEAAFWSSFPFQFDDGELIHLRHAYRNNIITGASPFAIGSGMERPELMDDPIANNTGLRLDISTANPNFALGEPVVLTLKLQATDQCGKQVHPYLHPNTQLVTIAIAKPGGKIVAYEPMIDHLVGPADQTIKLGESIEASAYIGFGKGGLTFDQPGRYQIRAIYHTLDGSTVYSNTIQTRVRYPVTAKEERLADLMMGEAQGTLLYLLGSDSDSLKSGANAFEKVLAEYGDDPMANYVRLVKGTNAARGFKTVIPNEELVGLRKADVETASALLTAAVSDQSPIDTITKSETLDKLAVAAASDGNQAASSAYSAKASSLKSAKRKAATAGDR